MLELWQAEWCPYSQRVRMRLTELGLDVVLRQAETDAEERDRMAEATGGERKIPTLVTEDAGPIQGTEAILAYLDEHGPDAGERARRHRAKWRAERDEWRELVG